MRIPIPSPPCHPAGNALSDSEKAEALADTLETQFQPLTDPSVPAFIEKFDVEMRSYFVTPDREPNLTNTDEVHEAIKGLQVRRPPDPNGIPNRTLKHFPHGAVSLLGQIFNAVLRTKHLSQV